MTFPREWSEFIASLCSHRVRFLLVGAHAVAVHGRPRATQDLDIFVEPSARNAKRLGEALRDFGFAELAREAGQLAEPDRMVTLGREPLRIDVMTSITGVTFDRAWQGRVRVKVAGHTIGVLGRRELVRNKTATGRTKDALDLELLREARRR